MSSPTSPVAPRRSFGDALKSLWEHPASYLLRWAVLIAAGIQLLMLGYSRVLGFASGRGYPLETVYVWSCVVAGVGLCVLAGSRLRREVDQPYTITFALVGRLLMLVAFAFYAYTQKGLWSVVVAYSLYLAVLLWYAAAPTYHTERGREWRNMADMIIATFATALDSHLVGPPILLFAIPLVVGSRYLWIEQSYLTILVPMAGFLAYSLSRVIVYYRSGLHSPALEALLSPAWLLGVFAVFMLLIVAIPIYERHRTWLPCLERIKGFSVAMGSARTADELAGLVAEQMGAVYCDVYQVAENGPVLLNKDRAAPGTDPLKYLARSRFVSTRIVAGRSSQRRILLVVSGRDMGSDRIPTFSREDSLAVEIMANMIEQGSDAGRLSIISLRLVVGGANRAEDAAV